MRPKAPRRRKVNGLGMQITPDQRGPSTLVPSPGIAAGSWNALPAALPQGRAPQRIAKAEVTVALGKLF